MPIVQKHPPFRLQPVVTDYSIRPQPVAVLACDFGEVGLLASLLAYPCRIGRSRSKCRPGGVRYQERTRQSQVVQSGVSRRLC